MAMGARPGETAARVGIVVVTRDRREELLATLGRLAALAERPPIVVVDNASADGSAAAAADRFPGVDVVALRVNLGGAARNVGVRRLATPYVAFADDDSWWAPGALPRAVAALDAHPSVGVLQGRILVGPHERLDPTCAEMARSPLPPGDALPGPRLLGFIACGAVVRRAAFLAAGGFHPRLGVGGEEELLALRLAAAGLDIAYDAEVVAHHHPSPARDGARRRRRMARNRLWSAWLARRPRGAVGETGRVLGAAARDAAARGGALDALRGVGWVARERVAIPREVERARRLLDR
jgi:GT2 family glycosyltransferase